MPNKLFRRVTAVLFCLFGFYQTAFCQEADPIRPVTSAYMFNIGGAKLINTYLTPIKYSGLDFGFAYERMQAMKFDPEKWVMRLTASIDMNRPDNLSAMPICGVL